MSPPSLRHPARLAGASLLRLQSDERLAELAAAGHEAAFDAIVDRYRTPLTRYCGGIVGPSRAEDAVQQTLINAHNALQRTDEVRHLRSWLYRIAHNAALNVLRAVRDDVPLDAASGADVAVEDGPAAAFERSERFRATVAALQDLPERQRAALVLRELEGRSHEEIAAALGVTKGSARQHLLRARVALRTAVTAVTPYPLIVRLAEMLASPGAAGWTDAAVGAGAGATLAKLTAGVAATGALVGGAVGTERVVHHRDSAPKAAERQSTTVPRKEVRTRAVSLPASAVAGAGATVTGSDRGSRRSASDRRKGEDERKRRDRGDEGRGRDDSSGRGSGPGNRGTDDADRDRGSHGRRDRSGAMSGSGHDGSGARDERESRGRGGKGSGSKDGDRGKRDASGSGSSGRGSGESGKHNTPRSKRGSSGSSGSGSGSGSGDSASSGRDDDRSGSGSGRRPDDAPDATVTEPTPTVETTPPSTTSSDDGASGSGSAGDDESDSSGHSGSN